MNIVEEGLEVIAREDAPALERLLKEGLDPNAVAPFYECSLLANAARRRTLFCVQTLLKYKAHPEGPRGAKSSPLAAAIAGGSSLVFKCLIDAHADVSRVSEDRWTYLHYAAIWKRDSMLAHLLSLGLRTHVNLSRCFWGSPLDAAIKVDAMKCGLLLMDVGGRATCEVPLAWQHVMAGRGQCLVSARALYGVLKYRMGMGRDMAGLIARASWETRMEKQWYAHEPRL